MGITIRYNHSLGEYRATCAGYENFVVARSSREAYEQLAKQLRRQPMRPQPRRMSKSYNLVNDRKRRDLPGFRENTRRENTR